MDKVCIFTCNSEYDSIKKLGFPTYVYPESFSPEYYNNSIVIRAGNSHPLVDKDGKEADFPNVINDYKNVQLNVSKDKSLIELSKVVNTPRVWTAGQEVPKRKLVIVRPVNHSFGKDVEIKRGGFKVAENFYCKEFIKTNREYRILWNGSEFLMWRRVTNSKKLLKEKYKIRSTYGYEYIDRIPERLKRDCLNAFNKIGLQFGAGDILWKDNKYYWLEINSAMSITDRYLKSFYRKGIKKLIKKKYPDFKFPKKQKLKEISLDNLWVK